MDHGDIVIGIFLNLKKAFDTVDHNILITKLHYYGICGNIIKWFESYFTDRKQYIYFKGKKSDIKKIYLMELLKVIF